MDIFSHQKNINIRALSNIFTSTHTSYKYLFFQAILSFLDETHFKKTIYSFELLENKMLELAKNPVMLYKLYFGKDDSIAKKLHNPYEKINLMKYVPYRLIIPFLDQRLTKGLVSPTANNRIAELSAQEAEYRPIYKIIDKSITLYPEWVQYLQTNFTIIEAWAFWHWANYLQKKNPNTLGLINKLQRPFERPSLGKQTQYWRTILNKQSMRCIFTNHEITPSNLSLDHFLPWSFIGHDQLWNLIPMRQKDNASKGDNIPSMDKYLDQFIQAQKTGLEIAYSELGKDKWQATITDFATDFNMEFSDLVKPNTDVFTTQYKQLIMPLSTLAKNNGFDCDWVY